MNRASLPEWLAEEDHDLPSPGTVIGHRKDGRPIFAMGGGAAATIDDWIPIEYDSDVIQRVRSDSAIERYARPEPMSSKTKSIPRSAGITVSAGSTYTDDASTNDEVTLTARRLIARFKVDEDDMADANTRMNVIAAKSEDWAISYADTFDNGCLATTGAESYPTVPYTSVWKCVRTADGDVSYTQDANYLTWDDDIIQMASTPDGTSLYEKLSATFAKVEKSKYWSASSMLVIAAPGWREALRNCVDSDGKPIFISGTQGAPDLLFNTPIAWSRGSKTSATMTGDPTGNDLLIYANTRYLARGDRSGPESRMDDPRAQDDTDDFAVKFRVRKGFKVTHPKAVAVLERLSD